MTAVISEISDFGLFLSNLKSYWSVNFENSIVDSYLIVLNDFDCLRMSQNFVKILRFS